MANILDTSLALGSVPYNFTKAIIGNPSDPGATTQVSLTNAQKDYLDNIAKSKGTTTGTIDYSDYGSPTKTFSGISNMNALDASLATTMGGTGYTINPDGSINYTGGEYNFGHGSNNPITNFINTGGIIGAARRKQDMQMRFKQQLQQRIREAKVREAQATDAAADARKKRIEQEKIKTAQKNWKPTYNPASSHAEAQATGGDYHGGQKSTVDGQTTDWGPSSHMIARGGLAQHAPRYANGGLIDFFRYGGFIG